MHDDDRVKLDIPAGLFKQIVAQLDPGTVRSTVNPAAPGPVAPAQPQPQAPTAGVMPDDDLQRIVAAANALLPRRARGPGQSFVPAKGASTGDPDIDRIIALGNALIPRRAR